MTIQQRISNPLKKMRTPLVLLVMAVASLTSAPSLRAQSEGTWRFHPSFNVSAHQLSDYNTNHTYKIMDGPRYTYFMVYQRPYIKQTSNVKYGDTAQPSLVLFRVDNSEPQSPDTPAHTEAVASLPGVSGATVRQAEYFPAKGVLAVVYDNRNIDLIYDSGRIVNIPAFRMMRFRNMEPAVSAISFNYEGSEAYVGGNFGYFTVDVDNGKVTSIVETPQSVVSMGRLGDSMMVSLEDGLTYLGPAGDNVTFDSFFPMEIDQEASSISWETAADKIETARERHFVDGALRSMLEFIPVNEKLMACFYQVGTGSATNMLLLDRMDNGHWRLCFPRVSYHLWEPAGWSHTTPYTSLRYRTANGMGINGQTSVYYLKDASYMPDYTQSNPSYDYLKKNMTDTRLEWNRDENDKETYLPPSNVGQRFCSYNQEDYWFYVGGKGWLRRHYDAASNTWSDLTAYTRPNAPEVSIATDMVYVPGRGVVVRQPGQVPQLDIQSANNPDVVSIYKDGAWKNVSAADISIDAAKDIVNYIGISVDPLHPHHYYAGSTRKGFLRRNFDDPSDLLLLGSADPDNTLKRFGTFIEALPLERWKACVYVTPPTFDTKGNMWFLRDAYTDGYTELCLWKAEDVEAAENLAENPSAFRPFLRKATPMGASHLGHLLIACTYPGNENYLFGFVGGPNVLGFFDTKGQADLESVEMKRYDNVLVENAGRTSIIGIKQFVEDPQNGHIWFVHSQGVNWIDPQEFAAGRSVIHRVELEEGIDGQVFHSPFDMANCISICIDTEGRKWIGTKSTGVYCLSADGRRMLAHFGPDNSPVESGEILALVWNGDSNSLMLSSRDGIYEFTPFDSDLSTTPDTLRLWPARVEADYDGYVTLTGVPAGASLRLLDSEGAELLRLPASVEGRTQFPVRGADGKRLPAGAYTIADVASRNVGRIIIL